MIAVEVILYVTLVDHVPGAEQGKPLYLSLRKGCTIKDLLEQLKIPVQDIKLIYVNGSFQREDYTLQDGDRVGLFPPIAGG